MEERREKMDTKKTGKFICENRKKNDVESVIKDTIEYANSEIRKTKEKSRRIG